jgi:hypothetical protein
MTEALTTPDGRYIVVRGRLWRTANPNLPAAVREALVHDLMTARREVKNALRTKRADDLAKARAKVHAAKVALGERGPAWWDSGEQDFNRYLIKNTPYAAWYQAVTGVARSRQP